MSGTVGPYTPAPYPERPESPYPSSLGTWDGAQGEEDAEGLDWSRYFAALRRYKWLAIAIAAVGTIAGVVATRFIVPQYATTGSIWISSNNAMDRSGPIRAGELLPGAGWVDLMKSNAVARRVVERLRLFVQPKLPADSAAFANFQIAPTLRPGLYSLLIDAAGRGYTLRYNDTAVVERGQVGDSIGRALGFLWQPAPQTLATGRPIEFRVSSIDAAASALSNRIVAQLPDRTNFMRVAMVGEQPRRTAQLLDAVMGEFVATAADLKKREIAETVRITGEQLETTGAGLTTAENQLLGFQTKNITEPTASAPAVTANAGSLGAGASGGDPIMAGYFADRVALENVQRDREALERILHDSPSGSALAAGLWSLPIVQQEQPLKDALTALSSRQAQLAALRQVYTDKFGGVQAVQDTVQFLVNQRIPQLAQALDSRLGLEQDRLTRQVQGTTRELRTIPARTIEESRLRRQVQLADNLFSSLKDRYEMAKLAEASTVPDVRILDSATVSMGEARNRASLIILMALAASIALGAGLALGIDRMDRRFRYPQQASRELGLDILGAIPSIRAANDHLARPEEAAQVVEAFRTVRLALRHDYGRNSSLALTISSPGQGDGKTTVACNLALSFAEAGHRTVLVDGDTRRGQLHTVFGLERQPGLLDHLTGRSTLDQVLQQAPAHPNLTILACGTRWQRGPELLTSSEMPRLVEELKQRFDVILIDSPPLAAGIDPFAIGVTTGDMIIVLRTGKTDRHMAQAKLQLLERLPVRVVGAIINDIEHDVVYKNYSYLGGYYLAEDEEALPAQVHSGSLTSGV